MEHTTAPPLTTVQQCVVDALAAGSTMSDAARQYKVNRTTVYRWMKTLPQFSTALHRSRAEFVLARRDDLHRLSNRALETLLAILDNPRSSPAVQLRTSMFILQRPQLPKTGWTMPEPAPMPSAVKLIDSATIEGGYAVLTGLYEIGQDTENEEEAEENAVPAPAAEPPAEDPDAATPCDTMQHNSAKSPDVAPALHSCPVPPEVLQSRHNRAQFLDVFDEITAMEKETRMEEKARKNAAKENAEEFDDEDALAS